MDTCWNTMSDFFAGIYSGIKDPDVVMNGGPLPPTSTAGMPHGFDGTPDGRIDFASTLLGDLQPYAYGEPARLSTQAAYLNIPHAVTRIIPQINLPNPIIDHNCDFITVSHQVDDGDMAFVVRAIYSRYEIVQGKNRFNRQVKLLHSRVHSGQKIYVNR